MKTIIIFLFFLLSSTEAFCQEFENKKSIYLEFGGSAGIGSFNYENIFAKKGKLNFLFRIGISGFPIDKNNGFVFIAPTTFGALIGKSSNQIEIGLGQALSVTTKGKIFSLATPIIGYRYQNMKKKLFFRVTYTPLISYIIDLQYQHWAGVSIGYNLNFKNE